jgi:hypothetical protein
MIGAPANMRLSWFSFCLGMMYNSDTDGIFLVQKLLVLQDLRWRAWHEHLRVILWGK